MGIEVDWIRPDSKGFIEGLLKTHQFDLFIGSIHHVHTIPIDYDRQRYNEAREQSGGTDEGVFEDYFDLQYEMLKALKPPIIGHFDLIRLLSDEPDVDFRKWAGVWQRLTRNLAYIAGFGGVLELNTAALRKGLNEPYPKAEICQVGSDLMQSVLVADSRGAIPCYGWCVYF